MAYEELAQFILSFEHYPLRSISSEYFEWKLDRNPFLKGYVYYEKREGRIVGVKTHVPKKIQILGHELICAESGDEFTHPDFQRQGISKKASCALLEKAQQTEN